MVFVLCQYLIMSCFDLWDTSSLNHTYNEQFLGYRKTLYNNIIHHHSLCHDMNVYHDIV